jgi:hypothetical protein
MTHYDRLKRKRLGDILVDEDIATEQDVIAALQEQQATGRLLSSILLEQRALTEWELARVLVQQYQTPFLDLRNYTLHKDLIASFPAEVLNRAGLVPLDRFGNQVCFACQEIPSEEIAAFLQEQASGGIYVYIASAVEIRTALKEYAPWKAEEVPVEDAAEAPTPTVDLPVLEGDDSWKSLFDTANDDVLSTLDGDE